MLEETELQESAQTEPYPSHEAQDVGVDTTPLGVDEVTHTAPDDTQIASGVDYARVAAEDLMTLQREFPSLMSVRSIAELPNCARYGALRDLGLSAKEAYLAIGGGQSAHRDNRAHLRSSVPRSHAGIQSTMSSAELENARILFGNLSDAEIARLYQKVQA